MIEETFSGFSPELDFNSSIFVPALLARKDAAELAPSSLPRLDLYSSDLSAPHKNIELPVEVWSNIFSFVGHIPGVLELYDYTSIAACTRDVHGICLNDAFKSTMKDKLACSLVCKFWNKMVAPFLFQHLRITSGDHACAIAYAFDRSSLDPAAGKGTGKWTLRIDLALEGVHNWTDREQEAVLKIIKCCPNLISFSDIHCNGDIASQFDSNAFIRYLGQHSKVRRLEVRLSRGTVQCIEESLADTLEILWVDSMAAMSSTGDTVRLPKLRAWFGIGCGGYSRIFELPNLRACAFDNKTPRTGFPFSKDTIEYLEVEDGILSEMSSFTSLSVLTTNVVDLLALFDGDQSAKQFANQSAERILIRDCDSSLQQRIFRRSRDYKSIDSRFRDLEHILVHLTSPSYFPHLRSIGIFMAVSPETRPSLDPISMSERWVNNFRERGIRLQISEGAKEWVGNVWTDVDYDGYGAEAVDD
ncbi:hypothetical protein CPC08DRAFT_26190 [Agrocybe pediades]|nr:hypothetical protein CPC08DRAFT_26190 [Agrocybe pediades]